MNFKAKKRFTLLPFCFLIALNGCAHLKAHTEIASFSAPSQKEHYQNLAVMAINTDDLIRKQSIEKEFCKALTPTPCVSMLSLFPPFQTISDKEGLKILGKKGIDAILIVSVTEDKTNANPHGVDTYQIKKSTQQDKELKIIKPNAQSQAYLGQTQTQKELTEETQTETIPALARKSEGKILLIDVQSGDPVWGGAFQTQGQGTSEISNFAFAQSEALPVAKALKKIGILSMSNFSKTQTHPSTDSLKWLEENKKEGKPSPSVEKKAPSKNDSNNMII